MSVNKPAGRFGVTLLDSEYAPYAANDELLINKRTGRLFYKNILGEIIDVLDKFSTDVTEERVQRVEEIVNRLVTIIDENGPAKMVHFKYIISVEYDGQDTFEIPLSSFNKTTDVLILNIATTNPVEGIEYEIDEENNTIVLNGGLEAGTQLFLLIFKNLPYVEGDFKVEGKMIKDGEISYSKLDENVKNMIRNGGGGGGGSSVILQKDQPTGDLPIGTVWLQTLSEGGE